MELYTTLSSVFTVLAFVVFLGIVSWAWSSRRREAFAQAAHAPFALPDETGTAPPPTGCDERAGLPKREARRARQ
ncbi:MAG: cbb3-type cytochrome oxidase subunit 3 [Rudaea sp.]